ncbi:MAG: diaminopimelate decarboxylase, partial [Gammaproteobacteria bacterium]|nr:diaminopimelate decarboxylase [Gammaproteobacteria bacterium]
MNDTDNEAQQNSEKKPWVKPSITPLRSGLLNKAGAARHPIWRDNIDGVPVSQLLEEYGSPLYVLSEHTLRQNIRRIKNAFSSRYPQVVFGWSYKTNYLGAVCNTLHQEGSLAEVVSTFEYEKARSLGVPGDCIIFNGPNKTRAILERAISEGARLHIDHLDELYLIEDIANTINKDVDVTIRLNFDTGYTEQWSRFGFNIESGQA